MNNPNNSKRQFILINGDQEELDLLDPDLFAYSPSNLGISIGNSHIEHNNYFTTTSRQLNMVSPSFTLIIGGVSQEHQYEKFLNFVRFLDVTPLQLRYKTSAFDYKADVELAELEKTEITEKGYMTCNFTLNKLTPWYRDLEVGIGVRDYRSGTGKIYSYEYSYTYGTDKDAPTNPKTTFNIENITLTGERLGSGCLIIIESKVDGYKDPEIYVENKRTGVTQSDGYAVTLNRGDQLFISSYPSDNYALLHDAQTGITHQVYSLQKPYVTGFIRLQKGENTLGIRTKHAGFKDEDLVVKLQYREELAVI